MQCRVRVGLFCSLLYPAIGPSLVLNKSLQNSKGGGVYASLFSLASPGPHVRASQRRFLEAFSIQACINLPV